MPVVFTNTGRAVAANRMLGAGTEPNFIGIGTDGTTAAATDTALGTQVESRVLGTSSRVTTTTTNDTYRVVGTVTATAARAVVEAGTFDASSGGNMCISADFAAVNLSTGDSITITADLRFA